MKKKQGKIYKLVREYLGEPCWHPYHPAEDCPYLDLEPDAIEKFAKWVDRKLKDERRKS